MPQAYVTLEALLRRTTYRNGVDYSGTDFDEALIQLHLLY